MLARFNQLVRVDPYLVALALTVGAGVIFPPIGPWAIAVRVAVGAAVAGLFFAYGVRVATAQVVAALLHWRPQALVFATTYVVFPLLGLIWGWLFRRTGLVDTTLSMGMMFVTILPSTVQSSIALTAIAKGNVVAALCSASVSNLAGVFLVPLLVSLLLSQGQSEVPRGVAVRDIALQVLLPFLVGQFARRWLLAWFERRKAALTLFDRGSILLVVYSAFGAGMVAGVWSRVSVSELGWVMLYDALLLASVMAFAYMSSRVLGFSRGDEIAIVFCSSKKSMASGIPMANVLFSAHVVSVVVVPLMLFHQLQLFVCSVIAQKYARDASSSGEALS
jgi:solute carrier family 10 (sodium/bile acid cotransporter), member 7